MVVAPSSSATCTTGPAMTPCWRAERSFQRANNGGKTSTYVPSVHQLYVIHPKTSIDGSGLLVFHVND